METIYNPSSLHYEALKRLIVRMEEVMSNEQEPSSTSLVGVLKEWLDAPTQIDQGTLSPYPKSEEYEKAMREAERAIQGLYNHVKSLDQMVNRAKEDNKTEYDRLFSLFGRLRNLYADVESLVFGVGRTRTSSDHFLSDENIDYSRIGGKALRVEGGTVSLPYAEEPLLLNGSVKATIIPGVLEFGDPIIGTESNGFAGNNHEVRVTASDVASGIDETGRMTFMGAEDRNADLSAILDQDESSWFEYEKIDMRETEKVLLAQGKNLSYEITPGKVEPFIGKPTDGLKLHLLLTLDKKSVVNEIEIYNYVPQNYGATEAVVADILISDGANPPTSIFERKPLAGEKIFRFPPREAKSIQIKFVQKNPYPLDYGHIYYEQIETMKGQKVVFDKESGRVKPKNPIRIEGPLPEIEDMGYIVTEEKTGYGVSYGEQGFSQRRAISVNQTIDRAYSKIDRTKIRMGVEKIEALRYAIGIRDIVIKEAVYETEGELVTKPHYYDEPVERITIETDAVMESDAMKQGANVFYFVSVDDGAKWLPIAPANSNQDISIPRMYRVGQTDEETSMPVVETTEPIYSLRFKVVMMMDGIRTQDSSEKVYRSPQLFSYQAKIETKEKPRDSMLPKLAMPILPKGSKGQFNYTTPIEESREKAMPPKISVNTLPDWCKNKPMQLPIEVQADQAITQVEIYLNGKLLLETTPGTTNYSETLEINTDVFSEVSRAVILVKGYVGEVSAQAMGYVRIIPCADETVNDKRITVDASSLKVGNAWTITGAAFSPEKITGLKLEIDGEEYPLTEAQIVGIGTGKSEMMLTIAPEVWGTLGFTSDKSIIVTLTAVGDDESTWEAQDEIILDDEVEVPKVCRKIEKMRIGYFNWIQKKFLTTELEDFSSEMNRDILDDGRGVKMAVGWSKNHSGPILMVKTGLGETGGIILSGVEIDMQVDGAMKTYSMQGTKAKNDFSMVEMMIGKLDERANEIESMGAQLVTDGDLSKVARLERLNSWMVPMFEEEAELSICSDSIEISAYEPEDQMVDESNIPPKANVCAANNGILYQRYDAEKGVFILHYMPDGGTHTLTISGEIIKLDVGLYQNPTGPAISLRSATTKKIYISAIGVLRADSHVRAVYGQAYIGSASFDKKDESILYLGNPKDDAGWVNDIVSKDDDTEAPGLKAKDGFIHVSADGMMAYCASPVSWEQKFGYDLYKAPSTPPSLTLTPKTGVISWQSLEEDSDNPGWYKFPTLARLVDDVKVASLKLYSDGVLTGEITSNEKEVSLVGNGKLVPVKVVSESGTSFADKTITLQAIGRDAEGSETIVTNVITIKDQKNMT